MSSPIDANEATLTYYSAQRPGYEDRPRELSIKRNRDGTWLWKVDAPGVAIREPLKSGVCSGEHAMEALGNAIDAADQQPEEWLFYR